MKASADPYLDREQHIEITRGALPHWHQTGKIQFVTMRLADSLPRSLLRELHTIDYRFRSANPEPWDEQTLRSYHKLMGHVSEQQLHANAGSCLLRDPRVRKILADTLHHRDGHECKVIAYVIMPNHCHLLLQISPDRTTGDVIGAIKRYSAKIINRTFGLKGPFWQSESHDRLVRSRDHLAHCITYIRHNPDHLPPTDFTLYISPDY